MDEIGRDIDTGQQCADALVANRARLLRAEAEELVLAVRWAELHGAPDDPDAVIDRLARGLVPGSERFRRAGGAGTPEVAEFAAAELGVLLRTSTPAAASLIADAVDVRFRLPLLWDAVVAGAVRVWQARRIAKLTRAADLTREQAAWVDAETTPYLASLPWARAEALVEAKIIAADPAAAEARRQAAAAEQFVSTGRTNECGLKTLIAKASAGDVIWLVAMIDRIAEILRVEGDDSGIGVRRARALGILANPAGALALLLRHAVDEPLDLDLHPNLDLDLSPAGDAADDRHAKDPRGESSRGPGEPAPRDLIAFLREKGVDVSRLLPRAVLYLHLSEESFAAALAGRRQGVARMEGVGPVTVEQVRDLLRHAQVTVKPVIDLSEDHPVDGYEVPARMRDQLYLRSPASAFPFAPGLSRRTDADHTVPYLSPDTGGPPGQTRIGNLGRLQRLQHRVKTHGKGWLHRQPRPGVHYWRTPHGYWCRVDFRGTHFLGEVMPAELASRGETAPVSQLDLVLARILYAA
ncbi:hypothetical protein [Nocardioides mesophilus]|uniref:DUF222 domain-containing protein n=1 Tax=Nocardioides mesophilus TaxID=433659 RepID=A0A7G9RCF6_9ACTN|nr:hypothetical protein [Nocardioides mesophilus]QNN53281.1 hypothetical protein H9L09_02020 [Nocardioides mesophilus]